MPESGEPGEPDAGRPGIESGVSWVHGTPIGVAESTDGGAAEHRPVI